jgi:hypothetical protein
LTATLKQSNSKSIKITQYNEPKLNALLINNTSVSERLAEQVHQRTELTVTLEWNYGNYGTFLVGILQENSMKI